MQHKDKLEDLDFGPLINVWQSEVTVLVLIVIVGELDRLKESKDNRVRWRAGYTLAVLGRLFAERYRPRPAAAREPGTRAGWSDPERGHDRVDL
jgi:hypothetical protein